jgi:hypothetical protein
VILRSLDHGQDQKKRRKSLSAADFAADGEPYSEVMVTISMRILGKGITAPALSSTFVPIQRLRPWPANLRKL